MRSKELKGLQLSELTLGTVQLGIPYGLKADAKAATAAQVRSVLSCAYELGISSIDTASVYGDAEEKIGLWDKVCSVVVTTKVCDLDTSSASALRESMKMQVHRSQVRLRISCIPILMVHHFEEYYEHKEAFDLAFAELKQEGRILYSGVSAYSSDDYFKIADSGLDTAQIPVNILDWMQIETGGVKALADAGMIVFARSIYLQGLLLRKPETLPPYIAFAGETLERFIWLCDLYGMTQKDLALSYILSRPEVSSIVIGCRNEEQARGNCEAYDRCKRLTSDQLFEIRELFRCSDKKIILPTL